MLTRRCGKTKPVTHGTSQRDAIKGLGFRVILEKIFRDVKGLAFRMELICCLP